MNRGPDHDVELIVSFINTRKGGDALSGRYLLKEWLVSWRLLRDEEGVTSDDVRRVARVRAAFSDLIASRGSDVDERTPPTIESATVRSPLKVTVSPGQPTVLELVPTGSGVDGAMAELVAAMYRVGARGDLVRLKACHECGGSFFDSSRNRSRVWCDMRSCGSRAKSRTYRRRRKRPETLS